MSASSRGLAACAISFEYIETPTITRGVKNVSSSLCLPCARHAAAMPQCAPHNSRWICGPPMRGAGQRPFADRAAFVRIARQSSPANVLYSFTHRCPP